MTLSRWGPSSGWPSTMWPQRSALSSTRRRSGSSADARIPRPSATARARRGAGRVEHVLLERERSLLSGALVEVAVTFEDERAAVGVAHLLGDHLDVAAGRDHQRGAGVSKVVECELRHTCVDGRRLEHPRVEVVRVARRAEAGREQEAFRVRRSHELLFAQELQRRWPYVDRAPTSARLRAG